MNRRNFLIKGIGAALCAGAVPTFLPELLSTDRVRRFPNVFPYDLFTIGVDYGFKPSTRVFVNDGSVIPLYPNMVISEVDRDTKTITVSHTK